MPSDSGAAGDRPSDNSTSTSDRVVAPTCPYCGLPGYHFCCGETPVRFEMFYDCADNVWCAVSVKPIRCIITRPNIHGAVKALFGRIWDNIRLATRRDETVAARCHKEGRSSSGTSAVNELFGRDVTDDELARLYELMREGWC